MRQRPDILQALAQRGEISSEDIAFARAAAVRSKRPAEFVAIDLGVAREDHVAAELARACDGRIWQAAAHPTDPALLSKVSSAFLQAHLAAPLRETADAVDVVLADPFDADAVRAFEFAFGKTVRIWIGAPSDIRAVLPSSQNSSPDPLNQRARDTPIDDLSASPAAAMLQHLLTRGLDQRASDIHIEARPHGAQVRFRIDGVLLEPETLDAALAVSIIARVKVLADLNVADSRLPQDGRMSAAVRGTPIDVRIATAPTIHGEAMTLRLLNRMGDIRSVDDLDLEDRERSILRRCFGRRNGLVLIAGPTGSGKTTTLYAGLQLLREKGLKIVSIEDPVELQFDHVMQIQVAPQIGLTFASTLRSVLRHDPDVIMVGEIRDPETARIAVQAALTGHLVVASVHARDAVRSVSRILEMGIEPYQMSAAFIGSMAQRLVRRLCGHCAVLSAPEKRLLDMAAVYKQNGKPNWRSPVGCEACARTGYLGRVLVAEAVEATPSFADALGRSERLSVLHEITARDGYVGLMENAVAKAAAGLTSLHEALSVIGES